MAMELIGGEHLNMFYRPEDVKRSNQEHLEGIIQTLAWVANIDAFQHWLYEHPHHSNDERRQAWLGFYEQFGGQFIDWTDLNEVKAYLWHRQLHIFEVPFYYIEYGIAQLGAIGLWKQFKEDKNKAIQNYLNALQLGGTRTLPELYKAAGLKFDFSPSHISELMLFVQGEMEKLTHPVHS